MTFPDDAIGHIRFEPVDFEGILADAGIDLETVTPYEWSKFTDAFLAGTDWYTVAGYAADAILAARGDD